MDDIISILKWLPIVTLFFLLLSLIYKLEINRILLFIAIVLDIINYLGKFD